MNSKNYRELFESFDEDGNKTIDKQEMYEFINILLSKKEEMLAIIEDRITADKVLE